MASRCYAFTLNNYDEAELVSLRLCLSSEKVRYAVFGHEVGETGTPHLQGYVAFKKPIRFQACKNLVGDRAHIEVAKASEHRNRQYCSKDGQVETFGKASESGKRNDLEAFKDSVKGGCLSIKHLREEHSEIVAKFPRFCSDYIRDNLPVPDVPCFPLFPWQQDLNQILIHEPDDRSVIFVVDQGGNKGKSWFAKYYCSLHENAFLMRPGKHADMAYQLPETLRVLFLDCTRKQLEYLPYTLLEELKDGYVSCTKYESCIKRYARLHVVVLMNQYPDKTSLSEDRYSAYKIEADNWTLVPYSDLPPPNVTP